MGDFDGVLLGVLLGDLVGVLDGDEDLSGDLDLVSILVGRLGSICGDPISRSKGGSTTDSIIGSLTL